MLSRSFSFLALFSLLSFVSASTVTGQLKFGNGTQPLDHEAHVLLGGKQGFQLHSSIYGPEEPTPQYFFKFENVPPGDYALRIPSRRYQFQSYFVRVEGNEVDENKEPQVALWDEKTIKMIPGTWMSHPLVIHPILEYPLHDLPPRSLSLLEMLKSNPLIWVIVLGLGMVVAIPKLIENLDPETLKEVQQSQAEMQKNMASLQSFDSSSISRFLSNPSASPSPSPSPKSNEPAIQTTTKSSSLPPPVPSVTPIGSTGGKSKNGGSSTGNANGGGGGGGKARKRK